MNQNSSLDDQWGHQFKNGFENGACIVLTSEGISVSSTREENFPIDLPLWNQTMLSAHVQWFIQLRWYVVVLFLLLGLLSQGRWLERIDLYLEWWVCLGIGGALLGGNILFYRHWLRCEQMPKKEANQTYVRKLHRNIHWQIIFDLILVSIVVFYVGVFTTFAPFLYTIHLVLGCIFFPRQESFHILIASIIFYLIIAIYDGWLAVENFRGVWTNYQFYLSVPSRILHMVSAILIWSVLWFLSVQLTDLIRRQNQELQKTNEQIQQTYLQNRERMLYIAHQMKSPAAGIQQVLQLHRYTHENLPIELVRLFEKIELQARQLLSQVDDLLFLSRLQAGESPDGEMQELNLKDVVEKICKLMDDLITAKNLQLVTHLKPVSLVFYPSAVERIVENLVSNAVHYTLPGKKIEISLSTKDPWGGILTVQDEGIGIEPDELPKIFSEFFRGKQAKQLWKHSSGLGLAMVREIVLRYRLRLEVESIPGKGSIFRVFFPRQLGFPEYVSK